MDRSEQPLPMSRGRHEMIDDLKKLEAQIASLRRRVEGQAVTNEGEDDWGRIRRDIQAHADHLGTMTVTSGPGNKWMLLGFLKRIEAMLDKEASDDDRG